MHYSGFQPGGGGTSMLNQNDWSRYDPSLNSYSPLAQFSSHTLREHTETLDKLTVQLDTNARRLAELASQEGEDHRRYTRMLDALQREESDIVALLGHNRMRIEELEKATTNEVVRRREETMRNATAIREFEEELGNLTQLENELTRMKRMAEEKLAATHERRALFMREFRHGMTILETDHKEAKAASRMTETLIQQPASLRRSHLAESPRRGAPAPPVAAPEPRASHGYAFSPAAPAAFSPRPLSPPRRNVSSVLSQSVTHRVPATLAPSASKAVVTAPAPPDFRAASPPKRSAAAYVFGAGGLGAESALSTRPALPPATASETPSSVLTLPLRGGAADDRRPISPRRVPAETYADAYAQPTAADPFRRLSDLAERLHIACAAGRAEEIRDLLRRSQSIVAERHPVTGDTALHVLCGASTILLDAITEVCLIDSSLLDVFNKQGLTPFHVACLNIADNDHKLKMFLVTNLNCNPNQETGTGATVAHLCAQRDVHHHALRCVVERMRVDPHFRALLPNREGNSVSMHALDVARDANARYNADYLAEHFAAHRLQ